jgi:hypothetical protein
MSDAIYTRVPFIESREDQNLIIYLLDFFYNSSMNRRGVTLSIVVTTILIIGLLTGSHVTALSAATTGLRSNLTTTPQLQAETTGFKSLADYLTSAQLPYVGFGFGFVLHPPSNQFQSYQNPKLGFGIHYPANWPVNEVTQRVVKFVSQDGSYFVVHVKSANGLTLPQWTIVEVAWLKDQFYRPPPTNASSAQISDINGANATVNRLPLSHFSLAKQPAIALTYIDEDRQPAAKIWTIKNDNVFVLTYVAPDTTTYKSNLNAVMTMIKSFQIL